MSAHRCHAKDCDSDVVPELPFCLPHWQRCPARLKFDLWRYWRPVLALREEAKEALQAAIEAVASKAPAP
jgi:hypothetical protein